MDDDKGVLNQLGGEGLMGVFSFVYTGDPDENVRVCVTVTDEAYLPPVIEAFERFLLAVTFQPESIRKYINVERALADDRRVDNR